MAVTTINVHTTTDPQEAARTIAYRMRMTDTPTPWSPLNVYTRIVLPIAFVAGIVFIALAH